MPLAPFIEIFVDALLEPPEICGIKSMW